MRTGVLIVGGGIIGLEMATVYEALGVKVSFVELTPGLMPGCDRDLVRPLEKRISKRYERIMLGTKVTKVEPTSEGLRVTFEAQPAIEPQTYDKVLMAVGRTPNGKRILQQRLRSYDTDPPYRPYPLEGVKNIVNAGSAMDVQKRLIFGHVAFIQRNAVHSACHHDNVSSGGRGRNTVLSDVGGDGWNRFL